jgi:hypothetical protein
VSKIFLLVILFSGSAFAADSGALFGINYITRSVTSDPTPTASGAVTGTNTEVKNSVLDIKAGYNKSPLYFGGLYSTMTNESSSAGTTTTNKRTIFGASVGYHSNGGYFVDASYLLNGTYTLQGVGELTSGTGIGVDLGYMAHVTGQINLGVQLSYKSISFAKWTPLSGTEVSTTWKMTEYYPMLCFAVIF